MSCQIKQDTSSKQSEKDTKQLIYSSYQAKALIPIVASLEATGWYILIFEVPKILISNTLPFQKPVFKFSFFEKIFEHLIAPQAP